MNIKKINNQNFASQPAGAKAVRFMRRSAETETMRAYSNVSQHIKENSP